MADEAAPPQPPAAAPEREEEEETDALEELKHLYANVANDIDRFKTAAHKARGDGDATTATLLGELSGTVLHLMASLVSLTGEGLSTLDARIEVLEDEVDTGGPPNRLEPDEASTYITVLKSNIKMIDVALGMVGEGDRRDDLEALKRLNEERIDFTQDITGYDEDDDDDGDAEVVPIQTGHA